MKKRKKKTEVGNCLKGHSEANVKVFRVSNAATGEIYHRYKCSKCKMELNIEDDTNLIGNPFRITERSKASSDEVALSEVDGILA